MGHWRRRVGLGSPDTDAPHARLFSSQPRPAPPKNSRLWHRARLLCARRLKVLVQLLVDSVVVGYAAQPVQPRLADLLPVAFERRGGRM